ncbi:MAG: 2-dehydropantoate 2-reductase [Agromyces sp.]|nr:2-dehydropantoate 2-reductase [Agromyces sp.]
MRMADQRIAVLGAGANGASVGADLTAAGLDVVLIEQWPAHVEKMRADGVRILSPDGELHVRPRTLHLCEVAELKHEFDVVLMLMKAYDSRWAAQLIEPYLAPDGLMAGVQNGMTAGIVEEVVGPHRTMGSVIECSATMEEPGVVHRHTGVSRSWYAVGALPGGPVGREEEYRDVMIAAGNEALAVGIALGHPVLPIFGLTPEEIADPDEVVDIMTDKLFAGFVVPGATTTVLQDWGKGRHSEVDDLNGHVVARGAEVGVATPVNQVVTDLAHRIERGELTPDRGHLESMLAALR